MSLLRKFFYKKPPEGLLEISERVFVFDCCFSTDVLEEDEYKTYMGGLVNKLCGHFPDATFMVFNFKEGDNQSPLEHILNDYEMTVVNYPRQYESCPVLTMEMIHHFVKSTESWLSIGMTNLLLMHCERGGWPVLSFMLAAFLIYRKQFNGEQKTLDMIYKQAPREFLPLMSPLNPLPSQLRYLQYVSRKKVDPEWPPADRALTLDCVILRLIPNLDGKGGCRPIFRIYGRDPFKMADRTPKVLFSTDKKSKTVRHYKQAACDLVKIDIHCHMLGDVVLECITLDDDLEHEKMMFRVMFNTAFIRSNVLMVNREEIDILWSVKDQFPRDFRAEILFSDMDSSSSNAKARALPSAEEKGLPVEAFDKCQELFSDVEWLDPSINGTTQNSLQTRAANTVQEKSETSSSLAAAAGKEKPVKSSNQILKNEKMEAKQQMEPENKITEKVKGNIARTDLPGSGSVNERVTEKADSTQTTTTTTTSSSSNLTESNPDHSKSKIQVSPSQLPPTTTSPPLLDEKTSQCHVHLSQPHPPATPDVPPPAPVSSDHSTVSFPSSSSNTAVSASPGPSLASSPFVRSRAIRNSESRTGGGGLQSASFSCSDSIPIVASQSESNAPPCAPLPCSASARFPVASSSPPPPPPCSELKSTTPPPPPCLQSNSIPPPPPPCSDSKSIPPAPPSVKAAMPAPPPPPRVESSPIPPPPPSSAAPTAPIPPPPAAKSGPPPPPAPGLGSGSAPPPPPGLSRANGISQSNSAVPPPPGAKGKLPSRTGVRNPNQTKRTPLKPYHWLKLTKVMQGSLWAETQKPEEAAQAPEFDMSELESLFSATVPDSARRSGGGKSGAAAGTKADKVHLIDLRRAYNCEIMLTKVKIPLPDLMSSVLALDDSALDIDQVDNLIKFCPTKEEMELLKNYKGEKENLGKCEQFFLELMKVPRVESKLRVFSFKIQFCVQVSDLRNSLNIVNSASEEVRGSIKLRRIMQTILSLGNALNQGTARGSAVGFRLDSLPKLTDTRSRNNKMTLMHYLCKVLFEKLPELLDFHQDLKNLEAATKIQLKALAEEMQAISKGLEKVVQELAASENDGPVSNFFCMNLKVFLKYAEKEVKSVSSLYSEVGRNCDALPIYFGEDPARCPYEQATATLLNFTRMVRKAHEENMKQLEFERKKALKEAELEKAQLNNAAGMG